MMGSIHANPRSSRLYMGSNDPAPGSLWAAPLAAPNNPTSATAHHPSTRLTLTPHLREPAMKRV